MSSPTSYEPSRDTESTPELIRSAISEAKQLAHLELQLARDELGRELMQLRRAALLGALALVLTLTALSTLVLALVLGLGGTALIALIVGGVLVALSGALAAWAYRTMPKVPLERTRARLRKDVATVLPLARPAEEEEEHVPPSSRRLIEPKQNRSRTKLVGRLKSIGSLVKQTAAEWSNDDATRLAASLALYTLLSIAPLLVIAVSVAGLVFGGDAARGQISRQISGLVGPEAGQAIEALVANARSPSAGVLSTIVGAAVLLFGASGVFGELQSALNRIWEVQPKPGRGILGMLRDRFLSFSMVMGVAFLLLVSLVVSAGLTGLTGYLGSLVPMPVLWHAFDVIVGLGLTTVLFALTFKVVPDVKITWRDVWVGGFATAVAFSVGRIALAWYVGRSSTVSPFGAAGSLVALVVWVYYSAQILFMGAEFAQVYAAHYGSRIVPADNAEPLDPKKNPAAMKRGDASR